MRFEAIALIVYGILVAAGGVLGFRRAGSRASLTGGLRAGAAIVIASVLALSGARPGFWLVLLFATALTIFFVYRLGKSRKAMPAVPMIVLSAMAALLCVWALRR